MRTMAPLSWRVLIVLALEGLRGPDRTRMYVGRPDCKLASATNWPMKPVAPTMRIRPLLPDACGGEDTVIFFFLALLTSFIKYLFIWNKRSKRRTMDDNLDKYTRPMAGEWYIYI